MPRIEKEFEATQPGRYIDRIETFARTAALTRATNRVSAIVLAIVAVLVAAVTALGLFGLAAFTVTSRTKQIGTRRAFGARKFHILRYFLVENWLITTAGVIVGCILSLALGAKLSAVFSMSRLPLAYLMGGVIALWLIGLLAVLIPARRAAAISPAVATRSV